jgi:hypothetical protein
MVNPFVARLIARFFSCLNGANISSFSQVVVVKTVAFQFATHIADF